jgi:hypothetical protein
MYNLIKWNKTIASINIIDSKTILSLYKLGYKIELKLQAGAI